MQGPTSGTMIRPPFDRALRPSYAVLAEGWRRMEVWSRAGRMAPARRVQAGPRRRRVESWMAGMMATFADV